jgi:hypothetical protein
MRARTDLHNYSSGINYALGWMIQRGLAGGGGGGLLNVFLYKKGEITKQSGMFELGLCKRSKSKYYNRRITFKNRAFKGTVA